MAVLDFEPACMLTILSGQQQQSTEQPPRLYLPLLLLLQSSIKHTAIVLRRIPDDQQIDRPKLILKN